MDNLQPVTDLKPGEIPEGFSSADPHGGGGNSQNQDQKQQAEAQKQAILEQALTPDALARLGRIKLVKPEKAAKVENAIASMAMSGKLPGRINEGKLIEMLERGSVTAANGVDAQKISIQRKRYALDSDDDDDNDDDL